MAWVAGICIALFLLFAFPRQMALLIVLLVVAAVAVVALVSESNQKAAASRAREMALVEITARGDMAVCSDPLYPVVVAFVNRSPDRILNAVSFSLKAFRPGFSDPVLTAYALRSDRIMRPGETYLSCWAKPVGQFPAGFTAQNLSWAAEKSSITWQ
ncbi:hypothetical protein [Bosea sp. (in: a-proteobacteria)]|uniref:hypothetical protein n=1 Tax=Bosea sp. (in: a-proteobacteria) TaxID=1871050 RepID=UPI002B499EB9|nr:hypothetical protein [Bosea sp. (in: a-proteobacteria)]WRH60124.1 MAG: hypothetical protein RSE11_10270 [Bosea sp. (in: a-proteobacteria)]